MIVIMIVASTSHAAVIVASEATFRGSAVIQRVTVSTTFTVPSLGFFGFLGLEPPVLTVSHQERVIRPGQNALGELSLDSNKSPGFLKDGA
jgi:hypothetical protein